MSLSAELELAQWQSQGFWYLLLLTASLWFLRLYLHYLGQWLFLWVLSTPVTKWVLSPARQGDAFSSCSGKPKYKTSFPVHLLEDLKWRPDLKRQKKSLPEIRGFYYSYSLKLWLAPSTQVLNSCINIYLKFSTFKYVLISEQDSRRNLAMMFLFYFDFIRVTKAEGISEVMLVWFITILRKGKLASSMKWLNSNSYQTQAQAVSGPLSCGGKIIF